MIDFSRRNAKMSYKIAFFDMDHTLYQTHQNTIDSRDLAALEALHQQGVIVCCATGRPFNQLNRILAQYNHFDYFVLINGGLVMDHNQKILAHNPLHFGDVQDIVSWCIQNDAGLLFHFGIISTIYTKYDELYRFCVQHHAADILNYDENHQDHLQKPAYNAVCMVKHKEDLLKFVESHTNLRYDIIEYSNGYYFIDVFPADNDKSHGINTILKQEHLTWKDVICFGDSTNDIGMIKQAGLGVAMGNANEATKLAADVITSTIEDAGVSQELLKHFTL